MITAAWHWLIENGLYPSIVTFAVGIAGGWALGLRRAYRTHVAHLARIVDLLDTSTDGGLHDVVEALAERGHERSG